MWKVIHQAELMNYNMFISNFIFIIQKIRIFIYLYIGFLKNN